MLGLIEYRTPAAPDVPLRVIEGVRFSAAYIAQGTSLRARLSALCALRRLCRAGVRRAVFPEPFAWSREFARRGIFPVPLAPLYQATAVAILRCFAAQCGEPLRGASLAIAADSVTPELCRAVRTLSTEARYVTLAVPGGEKLARLLRQERGVALRLVPSGCLPRSRLTLAFGGAEAADEALRLDETLRVEYENGLPTRLLAALWRSGALASEELRVRSVARAWTQIPK